MAYAIIPARSGSKSIKDKNIQLLDGKPLLAYSIEAAAAVPGISRIIVSTDSMAYIDIAKHYGAEAPFLRPPDISGDDSCDVDWVWHLIECLSLRVPQFLVHLRPTSPLRDPFVITRALECIKDHPECTALRSVTPLEQSAYKHFEVDGEYLKAVGSGSFDLDKANKPRHLYPTTYDANGYVDILKTDYIMNHKKIHGNRVIPFMVPRITDIDTQGDLDHARYELSKNNIL